MSPLAEPLLALIGLTLLVGFIAILIVLFDWVHELVSDLVHDTHTYFPVRLIAGIIYLVTGTIVILIKIILFIVGGFAGASLAKDARDWWNK